MCSRMRRPTSDIFAGAASCATLGDWLAFAEKLYARENVALGQVATSAHDEALYLLLRALGMPLDSDESVLARRLTAAERAKTKRMLRRRAVERIPAAYLMHEAFFGGHRFYVDERVIIPRSYFLEIFPTQLGSFISDSKKVAHVADVCTGSGCLAVLLAQQFPNARIDAIDLSPAALAVAKINVRDHGLVRRVRLFRSDAFDAVPPARYDVILSNPPYVPTGELRGLAPEFKKEPRLALDGGADGMAVIRKLLRQARDRLAPRGVVLLEVGGLRRAMEREFAVLAPHWFYSEDGENCCCAIRAEKLLG
ncbi:MAG: 50S ribosomal protein L3 N(5)-glutamine methyltransferase [Verrucomicrobiota bacterium]|nr:50S ribosomal protein L3 N(5)-glutamine methyltransferase [Verrucomicrobiota bacterium]